MSFLTKKTLRISRQRHIPLFKDWLTQSVSGESSYGNKPFEADIDFNATEKLLNNIIKDPERFLTKKKLRTSRERHIPFLTDLVKVSGKSGITQCKWVFV